MWSGCEEPRQRSGDLRQSLVLFGSLAEFCLRAPAAPRESRRRCERSASSSASSQEAGFGTPSSCPPRWWCKTVLQRLRGHFFGQRINGTGPVRFFHFAPEKSCEASPASGRRSCRGACTASKSCCCHVGLGHLRLHPPVRQVGEARVADHVTRVVGDHQTAGVPLVRGQGQLRREALRLHQRLVVEYDELTLARHRPAPGRPARSG